MLDIENHTVEDLVEVLADPSGIKKRHLIALLSAIDQARRHTVASRVVTAVCRRSRHRTRPWRIRASGTAKVGTITSGYAEMRRFGASRARRCGRPGEVIAPIVTATPRLAIPKMHQA
jgi:hypothetical protein